MTAIIEDQRAALCRTALLRGDEDVAGGGIVRLNGNLDDGGFELRARAKGHYITGRLRPGGIAALLHLFLPAPVLLGLIASRYVQ